MKKIMILLISFMMSLMTAACGTADDQQAAGTSSQETQNESVDNVTETEIVEQEEETMQESNNNKVQIQIGETTLTATLEDNDAANALKDLILEEPLTIEFSQYGGFEQVGSIGTSLPRKDVQTTTSAGDIVLYSGNQMVMFYGSNSWAYTRLGKIDDLSNSELDELLGNGNVTATFTLAE
ncbi:MAG: hypothetical protein EOM40_18990 [Clostridia bacterium]|nr:hypothetical protein [Clostridia bacterium]